jgi:phospholipid/cholesterol/gamma-HCH transport system ATP-binding protein
VIRIQGLHKRFGETEVLRDINLTIEDGETFAIIGRSGSGKSVLMKHLVGLLAPTSGRVLVDGIDVHGISYNALRSLRRKFGLLFQGGALFDSMSAFDNVAFPLRTFTRLDEDAIQEEVRECLELVQLPHVSSQRPSELSGGQQKRVALARAISLRPQYILYDEPTSGLDPQTSNTINDLIRGLSDRLNVTSIVITHDMHSVLSIADRAAFIHEGAMRWVGTVDDLHESADRVLVEFVNANAYQIGPRNGIVPVQQK